MSILNDPHAAAFVEVEEDGLGDDGLSSDQIHGKVDWGHERRLGGRLGFFLGGGPADAVGQQAGEGWVFEIGGEAERGVKRAARVGAFKRPSDRFGALAGDFAYEQHFRAGLERGIAVKPGRRIERLRHLPQ